MATSRHTAFGEERREALLTALEELLAENPLDAISIADITRKAGVTRSGFYFYFSTKAAAVAALLEDLRGQMIAVAADWYERSDAPHHDRVRRALGSTIVLWREHATLMIAMFDAAGSDTEARALWEGWIDALAQRAAARIAEDRAAGLAPDGADVGALSAVLTGMTVRAMERDVRDLVETGTGTPGVEEALIHAWDRAVYGV
jgi:TetR/AcrR family transcriptional regulator, ethionamide resistance regulator